MKLPNQAVCISPLFAVVAGCVYTSNFDHYTYDDYSQTQHSSLLDLVGARDITVHWASQRDLSDRWFKFKISREDFTSLVESIAARDEGPSPISWAETAMTPKKWEPEHSPPSWWQIPSTTDHDTIAWCSELRRSYYTGWYFCRDHSTGVAICWRWSYQHGDDMCED